MNLKRFFQWLTLQPGYKSRLKYSDAEYFNLSGKDARVATARREQRAPTLKQIRHVIGAMPSATELDRRNRALIVFTLRGAIARPVDAHGCNCNYRYIAISLTDLGRGPLEEKLL